MTRVRVSLPVDVRAPAQQVWEYLTDWARQDEWMFGTRVEVVGDGDGRGVGGRLSAFTGIGPVGFTDPMQVTEWVEPQSPRGSGLRRCVVRHDGWLVRGEGEFEVLEFGDTCRVRWVEKIDLPLGVVGRVLWPVVKPVFRLTARRSLQKMARRCEKGG